MAAKNKTTATEVNVTDFVKSYVDHPQKQQDSFELIRLMQHWSGDKPKMWGPTIVGFGHYHYRYASGHEGDAPLIAFSPRKAAFSLYVVGPGPDYKDLLDKLGKYRMGKFCIYFRKLDDLNLDILERICKISIQHFSTATEFTFR